MSVKNGDLISLGDNLLLCGDSTDSVQVASIISNKKVNLILTDPPYGVAYVQSKKVFSNTKSHFKEIANDQHQSEEQYQIFTQKWLSAVKTFLADKNSFYIFNSDRMIFALKKALDDNEFKFCQLLIWIKNHSVIGRMDYLPQHELVAYGWCGSHRFYKNKDKSILAFPKPNKSPLHPTMKPVSLLRHLILNSTKIGDYVFDPFGGSGSTMIACEQTKRKCLMIEQDLEYCQVIVDRFNKIKKI